MDVIALHTLYWENIKAPYKVCLNGKMIVKMKKKEFLEIYVDPMTVNLTRAYNRTKGNK